MIYDIQHIYICIIDLYIYVDLYVFIFSCICLHLFICIDLLIYLLIYLDLDLYILRHLNLLTAFNGGCFGKGNKFRSLSVMTS